jgi:hypothetical protein
MQIYAENSLCDLLVATDSELEVALSEFAKAACTYEDLQRLHAMEGRYPNSFEDELSAAVEVCQSIIEKQRQIGQRMQVILNESFEKQIELQQKIALLEKEQHVQIELIQQLFQLLGQLLTQLKIYSDYMQTLDTGICVLIEQQNEINQRINSFA